MFRNFLFATIAIASFCQTADAQLNVIDMFYDYKIEIRERSQSGLAVFYDTHAPISNPLHQINRNWRAFQSREEADLFFESNPEYEILEKHHCWVDETDWVDIGKVGSYAEAESRENELQEKNGYSVEVRILPVYTPIMQTPQLPKPGFQQQL